MPFTINDYRDLIRLLDEHPEWRAELRRTVLTDELLDLPRLMRELAEGLQQTQELLRLLAEAQTRAEARLEGVEARLEGVEARLERVEARLEGVEARLDRVDAQIAALVEAQNRAEARLESLDAQIAALVRVSDRAEARLERGERRADRIEIDLAELKGDMLEMRYREHAYGYFGRLIRAAHTLNGGEVDALLRPAVERGQLPAEEEDDLLLADAIVHGRRAADGADVYLVAEISWTVGVDDVEPAARRAQLLAKAGVLALPVVAGNAITSPGQRAADAMAVQFVGRRAAPSRTGPSNPPHRRAG